MDKRVEIHSVHSTGKWRFLLRLHPVQLLQQGTRGWRLHPVQWNERLHSVSRRFVCLTLSVTEAKRFISWKLKVCLIITVCLESHQILLYRQPSLNPSPAYSLALRALSSCLCPPEQVSTRTRTACCPPSVYKIDRFGFVYHGQDVPGRGRRNYTGIWVGIPRV